MRVVTDMLHRCSPDVRPVTAGAGRAHGGRLGLTRAVRRASVAAIAGTVR
jgi:hypothetical protein